MTKIQVKPTEEKILTLNEKVKRIAKIEAQTTMERFCWTEKNDEFFVFSTKTWELIKTFDSRREVVQFVFGKNQKLPTDKYIEILQEYKQLVKEVKEEIRSDGNNDGKESTVPERVPLLASKRRKR